MLKKLALLLLCVVAVTSFVGCNSDDDYSSQTVYYSSTIVTKFKLKSNPKVLTSLDTVFFSIDLVNARIFNADSLPYGTKVNKLPVDLTTDMCRVVELTMRLDNGSDTTVNYLTNSTDSINFAHGPVKLHVVSYDNEEQRDYFIEVNVHKTIPDSLYWDKVSRRNLPSNLTPKEQKTVKMGNKAYCLTSNASGSYSIASTDDPAGDNWQVKSAVFGFAPQVSSLSATADALFILSTDGSLYTSADGSAWTHCADAGKWNAIVGGYQTSLLGLRRASNGNYYHTKYPSNGAAETQIPAGFPVSGLSNAVEVGNKWTAAPQLIFAGGRLADGSLSSSVWGYDGRTWARLGKDFPKANSEASLLSFDVAVTDSVTWTVTEMPALLLIGGRGDNGLNNATYISRDMGMTWKQADSYLQLPKYIPARYDAQPLVFESTIKEKSRSASDLWQTVKPIALPGWWVPTDADVASRAIAPITQWECPYIYLFGGYDIDGKLYNDIWRGTINRLTFKPLQ